MEIVYRIQNGQKWQLIQEETGVVLYVEKLDVLKENSRKVLTGYIILSLNGPKYNLENKEMNKMIKMINKNYFISDFKSFSKDGKKFKILVGKYGKNKVNVEELVTDINDMLFSFGDTKLTAKAEKNAVEEKSSNEEESEEKEQYTGWILLKFKGNKKNINLDFDDIVNLFGEEGKEIETLKNNSYRILLKHIEQGYKNNSYAEEMAGIADGEKYKGYTVEALPEETKL